MSIRDAFDPNQFLPDFCRNMANYDTPFCKAGFKAAEDSAQVYATICPDGNCDAKAIKEQMKADTMQRTAEAVIESQCSSYASDDEAKANCVDKGKRLLPVRKNVNEDAYIKATKIHEACLKEIKRAEKFIDGLKDPRLASDAERNKLKQAARAKIYTEAVLKVPGLNQTREELAKNAADSAIKTIGEVYNKKGSEKPQPVVSNEQNVVEKKEPAKQEVTKPSKPAKDESSYPEYNMAVAGILAGLAKQRQKIIEQVKGLRTYCRDTECADFITRALTVCHEPLDESVEESQNYNACMNSVLAAAEQQVSVSPHRAKYTKQLKTIEDLREKGCKDTDKACNQKIDALLEKCSKPSSDASAIQHSSYSQCLDGVLPAVDKVIGNKIEEMKKDYIVDGMKAFDDLYGLRGCNDLIMLSIDRIFAGTEIRDYFIKLWRVRTEKRLAEITNGPIDSWLDPEVAMLQELMEIMPSIINMMALENPHAKPELVFSTKFVDELSKEVFPFEAEVTKYIEAKDMLNDPNYANMSELEIRMLVSKYIFEPVGQRYKNWVLKHNDIVEFGRTQLYMHKLALTARLIVDDPAEDNNEIGKRLEAVNKSLKAIGEKDIH